MKESIPPILRPEHVDPVLLSAVAAKFNLGGSVKVDPLLTGISMNIWRHMKAFFDQLEPRGENMPFCVALGCDPVLSMAAAFRYDGDEYEVAGSLRGAPIPLVKAITCDVLVPAWAEIVIEGEVLAGQRRMEGPMGEFTGHYSGSDEKHVARIRAITHRQQPIYQTMTGGGFEHVIVGNMIQSNNKKVPGLVADAQRRAM